MRGPYCPDKTYLVEGLIDRVLTQYRESPNLLFVLRTYMTKVFDAYSSICDLPSYFDLDTAVGEQLTFVGERMGWPRCHCVCTSQPVFGFACDDYPSQYAITGFCDGAQTWADCGVFLDSTLCLDDDEVYRLFLKVRRYQMLALYDRESLNTAIRLFWGPRAWIVYSGQDIVVVSPGRKLTPVEESLLQLYPRVLPIAPGIGFRMHFGLEPVFGFGDGWGDLCGSCTELPQPVFGFDCLPERGPNRITGMCNDQQTWQDCEPFTQENSCIFEDPKPFLTEQGLMIMTEGPVLVTGSMTHSAEWMCPIDVRSYNCLGVA